MKLQQFYYVNKFKCFRLVFRGNANAEGVGNGTIPNGAAIGQGEGTAQVGQTSLQN